MANDTVFSNEQKKIEERVDTLVKYTRKQFYKNNFSETISTGETALELAREIGNTKAIFAVSSIMGNTFLQLEDTLQAKRIFLRSVEEATQIEDATSMVTSLSDLGNLYGAQEKHTEAIEQYKKALVIAKDNDKLAHLFILNFNLAQSYLVLEDIENASKYVAQTYKHTDSTTAKAYLAVAKLNESKLNLLKKEAKKAVVNSRESIRLAEESGYSDPIIDGYIVNAEAEALLENHSIAFALMQKVDTLKTEKYKLDKLKTIEAVTGKFKINEYQQELKAQSLQNEVNEQNAKRETTYLWIKIASGILLLSSIILLISYLKRKKLLKSLTQKNKQYLEAKELSERQVRAKNFLFSNITHELRTPMYGIIGISSLLQEDEKLAHQEENLNSLKFSADYLLSLVNNVLQLTQLEAANSAKLKQTDFNIRELVASVVESSKFLNTAEPNTYEIDVDSKIPKLLSGDDIKLSQVLLNIISNASKFTENGTITISLACLSDIEGKCKIHFSIKDTGEGMSQETLSQVFEEFAQTSSNYEHQGTGLGLMIVKKILELHDAELLLKSEIDQGTEASFTISYDLTKEVDLKSKPTNNVQHVLFDKRILVVDDNKINRLVTSKTLENRGATVMVAEDGKKAIEIAKKEAFDIILMDINMPGMNGFETAVIIRTLDSSTPIVALTAVEEEKIIIENTPNLLNDFILKPYKIDVFIDTILRHIK